MSRRATPWSTQIAAGGVLVAGGALAVTTPIAGPAIAAGVLFAVGLLLAVSDDLRLEGVGLGLAAASVFGVGMGTLGALYHGSSMLAAVVAVLGSISVAFGLGLGQEGTGMLRSVATTTAAATVATFVIGVAALLLVGVDSWSTAAVSTVLGLHEPRVASGVLGGLVVALVVSAFLAVRALPAVAILGTNADDGATEMLEDVRTYLAAAIIPSGVVVLIIAAALQTAPFSTGATGTFLSVITSNTLLRVLLVAVILILLGLAVLGVVMRVAWDTDAERVQAWGTTVGGAGTATVAVLAAAPVVLPSVGVPETVGTTFVTAGGIGAVATVALTGVVIFHRVAGQRWSVSVVGTGLAAVVAATVGSDAVVAPLVAVGALLIAWDATSHSRSLTAELGDAAPTEQGELAHGGASIAIAAVGIVVATVAAYLLPWLEPLLVSGNAATSVGVGAVLIVAGAVLVAID